MNRFQIVQAGDLQTPPIRLAPPFRVVSAPERGGYSLRSICFGFDEA